ncbi:hypothetical protein SH467x_003517 [Pirellulaceae bacterium SH467]
MMCIGLLVGILIPIGKALSGLQIGELFRIWMCIVWLAMVAEIPVRFFFFRSFIVGITVSIIGAVLASFVAEPFNELHSKNRNGPQIFTGAVVLFVITHVAVVVVISFLANKLKVKRMKHVTSLVNPPESEHGQSSNVASPAEPL